MSEPHGAVQLRDEIRAAIAGEVDAAPGQQLLTDAIECSICTRTALRDPVQTPCEHVFHRACLKRALKGWPQCPKCRAEIPGDAVFAPPGRVVRKMITRLLVPCPQQCGARPMPFGSLSSHIEAGGDCPETPIHCANERCRVVTARREAGQHAAVCPHRKEPCPTCNAKIHHSDLQKHNATHGEKRRVPCQHCAELVVLSEQQQHLLEDCSAAVPMKQYARLQQQKQGLEQRVQELLSAQQQKRQIPRWAKAGAAVEALWEGKWYDASIISVKKSTVCEVEWATGQWNEIPIANVREATGGAPAAAEQDADGGWGSKVDLVAKRSKKEQGKRVHRVIISALRPSCGPEKVKGIFFDLECKERPVVISALWIWLTYPGANPYYTWYTRRGSYKLQLDEEGWEKLGSHRYSSHGDWDHLGSGQTQIRIHPFPFSREVAVAAGGTQAFYVHCMKGAVSTVNRSDCISAEDESIVLRPGTHSDSELPFYDVDYDNVHGNCHFIGKVEYRVTE